MSKHTAVILFNLGGPDAPEAVQPFLFNLFNDKAIIRLPGWFRTPLAKFISRRRAPKAQGIYAKLGGKSPIREETEAQVQALQAALGEEYRVYQCQRYWHPMTDEVVDAALKNPPEKILLLPLYPQFSTTTTASSVEEWHRVWKAKNGAVIPHHIICCYPTHAPFIEAVSDLVRAAHSTTPGPVRLLFSAHGLPEKVVRDGDPYQWQVEQTVAEVLRHAGLSAADSVVCYQSRVGPLKWIGPPTEEEILRAGKEGKNIILVPVAFVSEHSETLVELDMEYRDLAHEAGVQHYVRVPTVRTHPRFIAGLAELCRTMQNPSHNDGKTLCSHSGGRICPKQFSGCPHAATM